MSRRPAIAVIADDLTGAAEIGGVGVRFGLCAEVLIGPETASQGCEADLVCIDSDSRSKSPSEAATIAARCAAALKRLSPAWIYKKVDSVLRGNVLAEITAIMRETGLPRALLVPANPSFGRVIRAGTYFIKGIPIAETDFARDPEYPRRSSDVRALLGASATSNLRLIKPHDALPDYGIALCEVSNMGDLQHWAQRASPDTFCAGGAEFFTALLQNSERPVSVTQKEDRIHFHPQPAASPMPRELFVCGSISEATQTFVTQARAKGTPVFHLPHSKTKQDTQVLEKISREAAKALEYQSRVILSVQPPRVEAHEAARQFALDLVKMARSVLACAPAERLYAEGGATAAALTREMGWNRLEVIQELAPGVTSLRPEGMPILLTVKPGSYPGWKA